MKRLAIVLLCIVCVVMIALVPATWLAADTAQESRELAADTSDKEEVVYATLVSNGEVQDIYVVNVFEQSNGKEIVDYGDYTNLVNLTTEDAIGQDGDRITVRTEAENFFYQGTLEGRELPWKIEIRYYLDGEESTGPALAGKSGALKIEFSIVENTMVAGDFFERYALQVAMTFDGDKCTHIQADGATVANAGKNKQVTYMALPGQGLEGTITADVTDFAMDPITINGIGFELNFELDNADLPGGLGEMEDGVKQLNDGVGALVTATAALRDGTAQLAAGSNALHQGLVSFDGGVGELSNGLAQLSTGMDEFVAGSASLQAGLHRLSGGAAELATGSGQFMAALTTLEQSVTSFLDNFGTVEDLTDLAAGSAQIKDGIDAFAAGLGELSNQLGAVNVSALVAENQAAIAKLTPLAQQPGNEALHDAIKTLEANNAALESVGRAQAALGQMGANVDLAATYGKIDAAIQKMAVGLDELVPALTALKDGLATLSSEYAKLHDGTAELAAGLAETASAYDQLYAAAKQLSAGVKSSQAGASALHGGSSDLAAGAASLHSGIVAFGSGSAQLVDGVRELKKGTQVFYDEIRDIDIDGMIDEMIAELSGGDDPPVSFVSSKNTDVKSVQFAMTTAAIEYDADDVVTTEEPETKTFWSRFLDLFRR